MMLWSWAAAVLAAVAIAAPPSIDWEYAPPWQPLNEPCASCQQPAGSSRQSRTIRPSFSHEDLQPGEERKLNPEGRTTIVKMAIENVPTSDNSTVQLVFIPEGRLLSLADRGLARMVTSESQTFSSVIPAPTFAPRQGAEKRKRDHQGQEVAGEPNANSFPMTLVAAEGREDTAREQLLLLEAALSSHHATVSHDGQLPRVFIAPSNIPPPPGYVKIPLVPQRQAELRENLPPTFLTHSNPSPLPPGFVRLSLPPSVSHLSKDIPLVESQRFQTTLSNNFITESPFENNEVSVLQLNNFSGRPPPPPPTFDNRGIHEQSLQVLANDKREVSPQTFSRNEPRRINNEIIHNKFPNSVSPLPKIVSQRFPSQGPAHFSTQQNRGFFKENNLGAEHDSSIRNLNNNREQARPAFNNVHSFQSSQNINLQQTPFGEPTNIQHNQQKNEKRPSQFTGNVRQQHQIKNSPQPLVINTNIPKDKFDHQRRLQEFNRNQNFPSQNFNFNNQATNFPVGRPTGNGGSSQRGTEVQFGPPRPSAENPFPAQGVPTSRFPPSFNAPNREQNGNGVRSFSNQNIARPSLDIDDRRQPSPSLTTGVQNSREFNRKPSKQSFVPLPSSVNQEQIQQIVSESELGRFEASSSRPFISNTLSSSFENDKQKINNPHNSFESSPKIGIQVVSKGEPKTQEQTGSTPQPETINTSNFPSNVPSRTSVQSTTRRPQFSVHPSSNVLPIIGTPANIPFRERSKEFGNTPRVPSSSNSQFLNEDRRRDEQNEFSNNQRPGNLARVNQRESVSPSPSNLHNSDVLVEGNVLTSSRHGGFLSSTELRQNNQGQPTQSQNIQPKQLSSFQQRETEASIKDSRPTRVRLQNNDPSNREQDVENLNIPSPGSFENQFRGNSFPASATPRITTFSPFSVTPIQSTFSTTAQPPRRTTFAPHVTSFSPPRFFQSSPVPIPNIVDNSVVDFDTPQSGEGSSFSSLHTTRPFISSSELPLLSSPRPHISTTPRPEIISTFNQFPSTVPSFAQSTTTEIPPFTSTLHPNFDTTIRPFSPNTETPFFDLDNIGPFKIQPFFNSFALPQPIRAGSGRESFQTIDVSPHVNKNLNGELPSSSNTRGETQQSSISPSPVPHRNSQGIQRFENSSPRTQLGSQENFVTTLPGSDSSERPFTLNNEERLQNNVRRPSQRFSSRNRDQIQTQSQRVIPTPQKVDVPHDRVRPESSTARSLSPLPDTTERNRNPAVKVTTFKPRIKFSFTKPTEKSVSVTESPAVQQTGESATTLFPPFSEARRRQKVTAGDKVEKVEKNVEEEKNPRKTVPFIFGRRIRQRPQQRDDADQTSSGSNTRVSNTVSTAQPSPAKTRLGIAGRNRIRGRFRSSTSTTETIPTVEEIEVSENIEESTASPNEAQVVESSSVKTGRRGSAVFKTRRQPASDSPDPQNRQRPGTRRVPQWLRERRRRLRTQLNATTTEQPVLDTIIDDPPIDFIDDNAFAAAESARVTFTQPSDKTPQQEANSNDVLDEESTEPTPVIDEITTLEEADQVTEASELTPIEDDTINVREDSVTDDQAGIAITTFSTITDETPLGELELDDAAGDDTPKERQDINRAALTSYRSAIPEQSKEYVDKSKTNRATLSSNRSAIPDQSRQYVDESKYNVLDRPTDDKMIQHTTRNRGSFSTYFTPETHQTETQPFKRADWTSVIQTNERQMKPAVPQHFHSKKSRHRAEEKVDAPVATAALDSDRTWEDKFEDLFANEKHSSSFGDRIVEDSAGKIYDGLAYTDYPQSEDHALGESRTHIVYAVAPSDIVRVHQENGDQNTEVSTDNIENSEQIDTTTETTSDVEESSVPSDISSNDEFASTNPEAFRTVADGFKKAEETQKPVEILVMTTEGAFPATDIESTVIPSSTTVTFEPTTEGSGAITEDQVEESDDGAKVAADQSTVLGHSTVLEITSSEPKVCFSNGKCIVARNLKGR